MPIPAQRDLEVTRTTLALWLRERLPGASEVKLSELTAPHATGSSNETLLFDAAWTENGDRHRQPFVVRVKPSGFQLFLESDFELQYQLVRTLDAETDVKVPPMRWYEADASILGSPFFVMDRVTGVAPGDTPPYHRVGFVADATPRQREQLWRSAMAAFASVHRVPLDTVQILNKPELGATGLEQHVAYWDKAYAWATGGRPHPVTDEAWAWCKANLPTDRPTGLSWGDARIGIMLFHDFEVQAVVDWEMASLAGPLADLGWWLFFDDTYAVLQGARGIPRLPGMGGRQEVIDTWQELTGLAVRDLEWYEVFAGVRYGAVMMRLAQLLESYGVLVPGMDDMEINNPVVHALAQILQVAPPGPVRRWA